MTPDNRRDGVLLVVLTIVLVGAMWPLFDLFVAAVIAAGLPLGVALSRWRATHVTPLPAPGARVRTPELNVSAIHVGGDIGGLIFVAGCVAIFFVGMPALRPFVLASAATAMGLAIVVIMWRKGHAVWSLPTTSILGSRV